MKVAAGVNTPNDSDSYFAGRSSELTMLDQTRALPSANGSLIRRRRASVEQLRWALSFLDSAAPQFSAKRVAELRTDADAIDRALADPTYASRARELTAARAVTLSRIDAVQQEPLLWVQSTRLYRRILNDLNKKMFGRSV